MIQSDGPLECLGIFHGNDRSRLHHRRIGLYRAILVGAAAVPFRSVRQAAAKCARQNAAGAAVGGAGLSDRTIRARLLQLVDFVEGDVLTLRNNNVVCCQQW